MTEKKLIKALEYCKNKDNDCKGCPTYEYCENDPCRMVGSVLGLINRRQADYEYQTERLSHYMKMLDYSIEERNKLKAEVEYLKADISCLERCMRTANIEIAKTKSEAIKEFAERLKKYTKQYIPYHFAHFYWSKINEKIDNLVKEMVGE